MLGQNKKLEIRTIKMKVRRITCYLLLSLLITVSASLSDPQQSLVTPLFVLTVSLSRCTTTNATNLHIKRRNIQSSSLGHSGPRYHWTRSPVLSSQVLRCLSGAIRRPGGVIINSLWLCSISSPGMEPAPWKEMHRFTYSKSKDMSDMNKAKQNAYKLQTSSPSQFQKERREV